MSLPISCKSFVFSFKYGVARLMGRNFVIGVQWTHGLLSPKGAQCGCVLTRLGYIGVVQEGNSKDTIASEGRAL